MLDLMERTERRRSGRPTVVQNARTAAELMDAIHNLQRQQAALTTQLEASFASNGTVSRQFAHLSLSRAQIGSVAIAARSIGRNMLGEASSAAKRISEAVAQLDLEQTRVKATLSVVEQVVELKACVLGVVGSMGAPQDWETAAEYISRASKIPQEVINSGFAAEVVPTAEVPDAPGITLHNAAQSLSQLFSREFETAVDHGDGASITRFFKMFPLIGRSKEGLDAYGKYVCQGVASRARASMQAASVAASHDSLAYPKALTRLFEHIAQVVDSHTPLVERHYGVGTMAKVVQRLHGEADVQGGIILDTWYDERSIGRKLTDVKSYAFSFLVQSFLPSQKDSVSSGRTQSPSPRGQSKTLPQTDDGLDLRDLDQSLNEISAMLMPWSLYFRFISSRSVTLDSTDIAPPHLVHASLGANSDTNNRTNIPRLEVPPFLEDSNLPRKVSKILLEPFSAFTTFFLRRSVEKAFQLDEFPQGLSLTLSKTLTANPPYITSAVDDVMYIVNQILQRSLATSQAALVLALLATMSRVLGSDFIGMIQRKMRDECYPKAAIQGAMPPEEKIISFITLANNLDVSVDYIQRIVQSHLADGATRFDSEHGDARTPLSSLFPMNDDSENVRKALVSLEATLAGKAMDLNSDALTVLFSQVVKPRIRPILADAFRDAEYSGPDDITSDVRRSEEFAEGVNELPSVKGRVRAGWEALMDPLRRLLTDHNSQALSKVATAYFSNLLERRIWTYRGRITELGAVNLERDVVETVSVIVSGQNFKSREAFNRCLEVLTIMNMEEEEWDSWLSSETSQDHGWVLDKDERDRARTMVAGRA